jgi:cytochrome c biogenesis protein CcmG, thiol:disulfide interchange protein DsbE
MKRLLFIAPVLLFVLLAAGFMVGLRRDPAAIPSALIDKPLPAFALAPVRENDIGLASSELRGEPMLLNVFGSWCVACRLEHPMLMKLRAEGVPIHGIDWKEKQSADGLRWLEQYGDPYVRVGADPTSRTIIDLGVTGAPETFVIDRQGRVRFKQVGPISREVWEQKIGPLMQKLRSES